MKISTFAVDETLELGGVWKQLGGGAAVLVARADNSAYSNKLRSLMEPHDSPTGLHDVTDERARLIFITAMAHTILLDWKGLADEDNIEVKYNVETAIKWLTKYKEFYSIVENFSRDISNYRNTVTDKVKEDIKKF